LGSRKLMDSSDLVDLLLCVECKSEKLLATVGKLVCDKCATEYPYANEAPILLRDDNQLFPKKKYDRLFNDSESAVVNVEKGKDTIVDRFPSRSLNLCRSRNFKVIFEGMDFEKNYRILVIGSGQQASSVLSHFEGKNVLFIFCDIAEGGDVDIFCDAHDLPFKAECFDGLITTAVMEHVLYPDVVAAEITRVLKVRGFVYSEIPFLQSVHMGAYDFTRYTLGGHRRLFEQFEELSVGMVAGAGTALIWSLQGFWRSMFRNRKLAKLSALVIRVMFFWLKYFDFWFQKNPKAIDFASATYFYGLKSKTKTSQKSIVSRYGG